MTDIKSMTIDELKKLMTTLGDKPFRAKQIYSWLHEHLVTSYDEMTNLSKSLREKLKEYPVTALKMVEMYKHLAMDSGRVQGVPVLLQIF